MRIRNLKHQYQGNDRHYLYISNGNERTMSYRQNKVCMHCGSYLEMDKDRTYATTYEYLQRNYKNERLNIPFCSERCYLEYPMREELWRTVDEFIADHGKEKFEKQRNREKMEEAKKREKYDRDRAEEERAEAKLKEERMIAEVKKRKRNRYLFFVLLACYIIYEWMSK